MTLFLLTGQFSFKGASENSTTNDQLNLPVSIEDDPEHGIRLIEEERITHLILTLGIEFF